MSDPTERNSPLSAYEAQFSDEVTLRPGEETAVQAFTAEQRNRIFGLLGVENNMGLVIRQGILNKDVPWDTVYTAFLQSSDRAVFLRRLFASDYPLNQHQIGHIFQAVEGEAGEAAEVLCKWMLNTMGIEETERRFYGMTRANPKICAMMAKTIEEGLETKTPAEVLEIFSKREQRGNFPLHFQRAMFAVLSKNDDYPIEGLLRLMRYEGMQHMFIPEKRLPHLAVQLRNGSLKVENDVLANIFGRLVDSRNIATETILEITARHGLLKRILWPEWRTQELQSILRS